MLHLAGACCLQDKARTDLEGMTMTKVSKLFCHTSENTAVYLFKIVFKGLKIVDKSIMWKHFAVSYRHEMFFVLE
jgi:hypothetical protein